MTGAGRDPTQVATALLEEVRADPRGWPSLDLHKLLSLWGFAGEEPLRTKEGWDVPMRYHPEHPDLNVVIFPSEETHAAVTLHVLRIIDSLRSRQVSSAKNPGQTQGKRG